jgi:hypothetical protein
MSMHTLSFPSNHCTEMIVQFLADLIQATVMLSFPSCRATCLTRPANRSPWSYPQKPKPSFALGCAAIKSGVMPNSTPPCLVELTLGKPVSRHEALSADEKGGGRKTHLLGKTMVGTRRPAIHGMFHSFTLPAKICFSSVFSVFSTSVLAGVQTPSHFLGVRMS